MKCAKCCGELGKYHHSSEFFFGRICPKCKQEEIENKKEWKEYLKNYKRGGNENG